MRLICVSFIYVWEFYDKLGFWSRGMVGVFGIILFVYICLVFLVNYRIYMM